MTIDRMIERLRTEFKNLFNKSLRNPKTFVKPAEIDKYCYQCREPIRNKDQGYYHLRVVGQPAEFGVYFCKYVHFQDFMDRLRELLGYTKEKEEEMIRQGKMSRAILTYRKVE